MPLRVVPITDEAGFFGMKAEWGDLLRRSASDTIFLTWEWLAAWWKAYGNGNPLYLLRVEKDSHLIGLAPFYRKKIGRFGLSFRVIALLGDGSYDSDYLDWISVAGTEETVSAAVMDHLAAHSDEWDVLLVNEIPESSPHLDAIREYSQRRGWYRNETEVSCAYVDLPPKWNQYLQSLKPRMRTKIRSLTRALEESHEIRYEQCERTSDLPERLGSLFELHEKRWQRENKPGVFASMAKRNFYLEMGSTFLSLGWLRFYSLSVDGKYVAHQYCFEYGNKMFLLQEGFDPAWDEQGVGNVLRGFVFRDCIERKVDVYDFLGGLTQHKLSWGSAVKINIRISTGVRNSKNRIYFELPDLVEKGKRQLKTILPEPVIEWVKAMRDRS